MSLIGQECNDIQNIQQHENKATSGAIGREQKRVTLK
jgi:hypothetical protein